MGDWARAATSSVLGKVHEQWPVTANMKEQVRESDLRKKVSHIQFGLFSPQEIVKLSQVQINQSQLYTLTDHDNLPYSTLDRKLGTSDTAKACETCGLKLKDCVGHFGYIKLVLPVFHVGYIKQILTVIQCICKNCSRILLPEHQKRDYLKKMRVPTMTSQQRLKFFKTYVEKNCKKAQNLSCKNCGQVNGPVKKAGGLRIVHERWRNKGGDGTDLFYASLEEAMATVKDLKTHIRKAQDNITPLRALELFQNMSVDDCVLVDMDPTIGRPELMVTTHILVPPLCIRPSVKADRGTNEDDITVKLAEIVMINSHLREAIDKGYPISSVMEHWDFLQNQCALLINSDFSGLPPSQRKKSNNMMKRGFCQRLKGKMGRFRGNLSGKRVNFSSRTVISPDPNIEINEVVVPLEVATELTFPEKVCKANMERLRQAIINGPRKWPGANFVEKKTTDPNPKKDLRFVKDLAGMARELKPGDLVERHLVRGDVVLFNRQPSLHKLSIMAHRVRVMRWRTFRFNECVCKPYNADFDGDEMNVHVPQTEEARAEALTLMGVLSNLVTPRNAEPLIAATQDFLTSSYVITQKDVFLDRSQFAQVCVAFGNGIENIDLPRPAILKPVELWTGKQIFNVMLRPNRKSTTVVNLETSNKTCNGKGCVSHATMCPKDGQVLIQNSVLLKGIMDKSILGDGSKSSLFYVLNRDNSPEDAARCMGRVARFAARYLCNKGFSIGISDVTASEEVVAKKEQLFNAGYAKCDEYIHQYDEGKLPVQPGCTEEETIENLLLKTLSDIRDQAGNACMEALPRTNAPLIMALSGSKGSVSNISQMIACVGQQSVGGKRVADGFIDRSLPHFGVKSRLPAAKGFVRNSFYTGMNATEFFFHTMGGREGLVDTAVKTAETGYMQRRLVKALEDLSVAYDGTVRNSIGGVVQFTYGGDNLDPVDMEHEQKSKPCNFHRVLLNARTRKPLPGERTLLPWQMLKQLKGILESRKFHDELSPDYQKDLSDVVHKMYDDLVSLRTALGMKPCTQPNDAADDPVHLAKVIDGTMRMTKSQFDFFLHECHHKYSRAAIEPGTAVGALAAQSIGEPGTQMTLKTFHFAGVASMNVTRGVPRIKEIINAAKTISTPIISAALENDTNEQSARIVKGRIEKTTLGQVAEAIETVFTSERCFVSVKLDRKTIEDLQLEIDAVSVRESIINAGLKRAKQKIGEESIFVQNDYQLLIKPFAARREDMFFSMQFLRNTLPKVTVKGIPTIERVVIGSKADRDNKTRYELAVEGYDMLAVMGTNGVKATKTTSNHVMEVVDTLGIEAARTTIMNEIQETMQSHGMSIDYRHLMMLADLMTFRGEILGIHRFGISKMKDSTLMLASFEQTTDHLFDAAVHHRSDSVVGVSECIIMGTPIPVGTGVFKLLYKYDQKLAGPDRFATPNKPLFFESHKALGIASA